ncbi:MAG: hypothetical protein KGL39_44090 [Patescibacteria group bacterium]|nr:hypothetical protein [Patescibacteria group bacterium]
MPDKPAWQPGQCCAQYVAGWPPCSEPVEGRYFCTRHWLRWDARNTRREPVPGKVAGGSVVAWNEFERAMCTDIEALLGHIDAQAARIRELEAALRECATYLESQPWVQSLAAANRMAAQNEGEECLEHARKVLEAGE